MAPKRPTFFVSYRRSDSGGSAKLLVDGLNKHFGAEHVFQDIEQINAGDDFPKAIQESLEKSSVVVVVIGPGWRGQRSFGRERIHQKNDWVRQELEIAVGLPVTVVPVLVNGSAPPKLSQLPPSISYLATLNATSLRSDRWDDDVSALMSELEQAHQKALTDSKSMITNRQQRNLTTRKHRSIKTTIQSLIASLLVAGTLYWFWPETKPMGAVRVTASPASDTSFDVGFWNLRRFSLAQQIGGRETLDEARIERVAQIIADLDLDVYGVLEVDEEALRLLITQLAQKGVLVGHLYQDTAINMDLAALYRRDRVQCQKDESIYQRHDARLRENDPSSGYPAFPRMPLFFICTAARLSKPIHVTLVHFKSMFGGQEETSGRRQLSSIILGEILAEQESAIVGGDFNAFPEEAMKLYGGLEDVGNLNRLFTPSREAYTWVGGGNFEPAPMDYIWASPDLPIKPLGKGAYGVIGLDENTPNYREEVSDHLPIVISVMYEE